MTELVVLDASVAVKWFRPERGHASARRLREDYADGTIDLAAPTLLPYEVLNALRYAGGFDADGLADARTSLDRHGLELARPAHCGPLFDLAVAHDLTVYDAAYAGLALERDGTLYTSDETLLDRLEPANVTGGHIATYGP